MKTLHTALSSALILSSLTSCYVWQPPGPPPYGAQGNTLNAPPPQTRYIEKPQQQQQPPQRIPMDSSDQPRSLNQDDNSDQYTPPVPPPPQDTAQPQAPQTPSTTGANLYGIKVPNKPGFVLSPYDKSSRIVDVQGIATGTKVKCPYTGKVFLVP
jgi:hypothetical protein